MKKNRIMKKAAALCASMIMLSGSTLTVNAQDLALGDFDMDGNVNAADACEVLIYAVKLGAGHDLHEYSEEQLKAGDVDSNGMVNARDAAGILYASAFNGVEPDTEFEYYDGNSLGIIKSQVDGTQAGTITVESRYVTVDELKAWDYKVPVRISVDMPYGVSALEFGVQTELSLTVMDEYDDMEGYPWYTKEYSPLFNMCSRTKDDLTWMADARITPSKQTGVAVVLLVDIPKEARSGDRFEIAYQGQAASRNAFWEYATDDDRKLFIPDGVNGFVGITGESPATTEPTEDPDAQVMLGDVDGSGTVDIMDVIRVNKYLLGTTDLDERQKKAADIDQNNSVDSADSIKILKTALGIEI